MYTIIRVVNMARKKYNIYVNLPIENTTSSDMDFEYSFYTIQGDSKALVHPVKL